MPFIAAMKEANIHAVIGLHVQVEFSESENLPLILYAQTNEGYQNLLKISSASAIRTQESIPYRWLQGYSKDCAAIIPVYENKLAWLQSQNEPFAFQLKQTFGNHLYLGLDRLPKYQEQEPFSLALSKRVQAPIIALHENLYVQKEDYFSYEVATAIETGVKLHETIQVDQQRVHWHRGILLHLRLINPTFSSIQFQTHNCCLIPSISMDNVWSLKMAFSNG